MAGTTFNVSGRRARLLRAGVALALMVALLSVQADLVRLAPPHYGGLARLAVLALSVGLGVALVRECLALVLGGLDGQAAVLWRNLGTWTLYGLLGLWIASSLGVNLSGLLVGGAILGVVLATASQASLGNFFAGLILMLARPYRVGAALRLRGSMTGGVEWEGTVIDMGALFTTLRTAAGEVLRLPNSAVVTSALVIGRQPLQVELELELPPTTPLRPLSEAVQARLGSRAAQVMVEPRSATLTGDGGGTLACRLLVRSAATVEPAAVLEALTAELPRLAEAVDRPATAAAPAR